MIGAHGDLAGLGEVDEPVLLADLHAELGSGAGAVGMAQPLRQLALVISKGDPLRHQPSAEIFASSSGALTGFTM